MRNIFLIPDDAVVRNLIIIFNFSSQRPHLNYNVFLSNVYNFDTMEFFRKHIVLTCSYLPTKLQAMLLLFNKSESLNMPKVLF